MSKHGLTFKHFLKSICRLLNLWHITDIVVLMSKQKPSIQLSTVYQVRYCHLRTDQGFYLCGQISVPAM